MQPFRAFRPLTGYRAILGLSLLAHGALAQAANVYVSPNGNDSNTGTTFAQPLQTIGAAIAQANDGDTILLEDGYYSGSGNFDLMVTSMTLTIKSINGPTKVTIDCQGSSSANHGAFYFTNTGNATTPTILQGLTIQNGYRTSSGGAITNTSGYLSFQSCVFATNIVSNGNDGGAIASQGGGITLTNCTFQGNSAGYSGAVFTNNSSALTAKNCIFSLNSANYGGGAGIQANGSANITACTFTRNQAGNGALKVNGTATVTGCTFSNNTPSGLYGGNSSNVTVHSCSFINNLSSGIYLDSYCTAVIDGSYFNGNQTKSSGGALSANYQVNTTLTNCIFVNNLSSNGGGAVSQNGSNMLIQFCSFYNNSDTSNSGGGAVYVPGGSCTLINSILWGDQASAIPASHEVATSGNGSLTATYCDIQTRVKGSGNITANPMFANATVADLHVLGGSPCYGVGTSIAGVTKDYQLKVRRNPPTMGAFEGASAWGLVGEAIGPDLVDHVLYANASGQGKLGKVVSGVLQSQVLPANGMIARYLAIGPTGSIYILWSHTTDNNVSVTIIPTAGATTTSVVTAPTGGLISGFSVSSDKAMHLNWQQDSGAVNLQKITSAGASTVVTIPAL